MLNVKTIARVLGTTEAKVRAAIRAAGIDGVKSSDGRGKSKGLVYGSAAIDRIKAQLGAK